MCKKNTDMPPCLYILGNKPWMPVLKIIRLACAVSARIQACVSTSQQLYSTSVCAAEILLWMSVSYSEWPALFRGPSLGKYFFFVGVLQCQLKEQADKPDSPRQLPLTFKSIIATLGGLCGFKSQWQRSGLLKWALSWATQPLSVRRRRRRRRMCYLLEIQSRNQHNSIHAGR